MPALIGPPQQCACNAFHYDLHGDHLQTCQTKLAASQVHDWVVYKLGALLGSVGHRVKIHKITSAIGKERGDIEIKDYIVLQKPHFVRNFCFVLGGLSRCFTVPYPLQGSQVTITPEKILKGFVCAHFSLHNSLSLSLS